MTSSAISQLLVNRRWILFSSAVLVFLSVLPGARHISIESDYRIFFDSDDSGLLAHEAVEQTYTKSDTVSFIVNPIDSAQTIFTEANLRVIEKLTEASWKLPFSIRVDSLTNFQYTRGTEDDLIVSDLFSSDEGTITSTDIRGIAINEPQLVDRIVSRNGSATAVTVTLQLPDAIKESDQAALTVVSEARQLAEKFKSLYPSLDFRLTGNTVVVATFNELTQRDMRTLFPLMLLASGLVLFMLLRSVTATVITMVVLILSIVSTFGVAGYLSIAINQVNAVTPMIILTLAICDCVHVYNGYFRSKVPGYDYREAMLASLKKNYRPVFLTTLTTVIGFASLNFSSSPPFRTLGTLTAIGVIFAFFYTLTVVPALSKFTRGCRPNTSNQVTVFSHLFRVVRAYRGTIVVVSVLLGVALSSLALKNELNDSTVHYFKPSVPFREAADFMQQNLTGFDMIHYSLDSKESNGISRPDFLEKADAFAKWLKKQPEIVSVITYTDIIKRLNKNMNADDPFFYRIPQNRELASQYLLLYELSLPFGLDLNNLMDIDKSSLKITAVIKDQKAKGLIELDLRAQKWLENHYPDLNTPGTGISLLFARLGYNNILSMIEGVILALILITLTLAVSLKSLKLGLLSIIPNALPGMMAIGLWGAFVGEVNLAVAAILSITLGIVVDDTVHIMDRYHSGISELNLSPEESVNKLLQDIGPALCATTLVLASGFFVLSFSDFNVNSHMGLLVSFTIILALLFDLLMLPALLLWKKIT